MNCAGKPVNSLLLMVAILSLLVFAGCASAPVKIPIRLIYPGAKPDLSFQAKNAKIYIQKPDISKVSTYEKMYLLGTINSLTLVIKYVTNDNLGDWIAGAIGQELRSSGYSVEFINEANDKLENVLSITATEPISVNWVQMMICRVSLKVQFILHQFGKKIKQFDISNEKDSASAPTLSITELISTANKEAIIAMEKAIIEDVLRDGLQELIKNSVPVIVKEFEGQ